MSWYDSDFEKRAAISAVSASGTTKDIDVVIPADWDDFWDAIDSSGNELRVTGPDGYTLLSYDVDDGAGGSFNRTTRAGRIRIDGASAPGDSNECLLFWVYYSSTSTQGDASVAVTIASALTGYIDRGTPSTFIIPVTPPRPGLDRPPATFTKGSGEGVYYFFDFGAVLEQRSTKSQRRNLYEEPRNATYTVVNTSAAAQATMIDTSLTRWFETVDGRGRHLFLRVLVQAGTDGSTYTALPVVKTIVPTVSSTHRTLAPRAGVRIKDVLET